MTYLKTLPIDCLKIDRSFVQDLSTNPSDKNIVTNIIISIAHHLNLCVTAEGVETKNHYQFLTENHCNQAQGFWFSNPGTYDQFSDVIEEINRKLLNPQ